MTWKTNRRARGEGEILKVKLSSAPSESTDPRPQRTAPCDCGALVHQVVVELRNHWLRGPANQKALRWASLGGRAQPPDLGCALIRVAQLVWSLPHKAKVAGVGTCLACRLLRVRAPLRGNPLMFSLAATPPSLSPCLPLSLKINQQNRW